MVEETETPRVLEELSKQNAASARRRPDSRKRNAVKRMALLLLFLVPLLAGVVFLGYLQWNQRAVLARVMEENSALQDALAANEASIAGFEAAITELEAAATAPPPSPSVGAADIAAVRTELDARIQRLNSQLEGLRERTGVEVPVDDGPWRLAEAEHLLRLANQQLRISENIPSTISLLQAADQLLIESDDARLEEVRQTLLGEIDALGAVQSIDREGLYLRLGNLRDRIAGIQVSGSMQEVYRQRLADQARNEPAVPVVEDGSIVDRSLAFLGSIFVWRRWEERPEIMPPPEELLTVKQNLNLMLEQAQLALLTRRPTLYRDSLQRARDWIGDYLMGVSDSAPLLAEQVDTLLEVRISPELPDISGSLRQIRQIRAGSETAAGLR